MYGGLLCVFGRWGLFLPLMTWQDLAADFSIQLLQTTILEVIAVCFSIASVLLANKNSVYLYPTGIISTGLYIYIMTSVGLYAETLLNGYYLVMSIYGWVRWAKNKEDMNATAISYNDRKDWIISLLIVMLGFAVLYGTLSKFTDSTVPVADAVVSAFAWAGMWLLAKHKIENWVFLNVSNIIAIPLLLYKGLPLTALLTVVLFTVAVFGYFRWKKLYHLQDG